MNCAFNQCFRGARELGAEIGIWLADGLDKFEKWAGLP